MRDGLFMGRGSSYGRLYTGLWRRGGFLCFRSLDPSRADPLDEGSPGETLAGSFSIGRPHSSAMFGHRRPYQPRAHRDDKDAAPGKRFRCA